MPSYRQANTSRRYRSSSRSPTLDRIAFTLDHIHRGKHGLASTSEVVKFLVDKKIPVTVFVQATSPNNNYELDRDNARLIYSLAPHLVTLGVHPLSSGHSQQQQSQRLNIINGIIRDVTGKNPSTLSYHGPGAGPEAHIRFPGIKYCRGISSAWAVGRDNPKDTPVIVLNSVTRALIYAQERNAAGLSATLFLHSQELRHGSTKKRIFDTFVKEVQQRRLQAVTYQRAMEVDFKVGHQQPLPSDTSSADDGFVQPPPRPDNTRKGSLRLSASTKQGRRPVAASFFIQRTNGQNVESGRGKTKQFRIPEGRYKVTARVGRVSLSETVNVSSRQGVHHIFLLPV